MHRVWAQYKFKAKPEQQRAHQTRYRKECFKKIIFHWILVSPILLFFFWYKKKKAKARPQENFIR